MIDSSKTSVVNSSQDFRRSHHSVVVALTKSYACESIGSREDDASGTESLLDASSSIVQMSFLR